MKEEEGIDAARNDRQRAELEIQNVRLAEALRAAEIRLAIKVSTARILSLALTRGGAVHDPELL
jgi:hypothetical protein